MALPQFNIFRPGTFTSVEGKTLSFSQADLEAIAAAYDPVADPAPLVVGHPKLDDPAFGWVGSLKVDGDRLIAEPSDIEPAFAEAVRARRYRKISPQFYEPAHPGNPKPGSWYLKHVGFLGAAAPAVKGLGTVAFADDPSAPVITIEQPLEETRMDPNDQTAAFAEREAEIARKEADVAAREQSIATREQTASQLLHTSNVSFAEQLVATAKLAPAGKDILVGLLDHLEATNSTTASFGEANGSLSPAAALRKLLAGAQPLVSLGEAAAPQDEQPGGVASFAAPAGHDVDPQRLDIHNKALELQAADSKLSYVDAVKRAGG